MNSIETSGKRKIPGHVGVILDGNRRWARERNLSAFEGHRKGYDKIKQATDWFFLRGIKVLSVFAFSIENWQRDKKEVNYLMNLVAEAIKNDLAEFNRKDYRVIFSGRISELPGDLPDIFHDAAMETKNNTSGTLNICYNYGGRFEIIDAIKKIIKKELSEEQIHEGIIKKYLYSSELPDPDVIVRTGGEQRLSGFLTWQSVYSELIFLKKYWPDFEEMDVMHIIEEYSQRQRRYGGN